MASLELYSSWYDNLRKASLKNPLAQYNQQKKSENFLADAKLRLKDSTYQNRLENDRDKNYADSSNDFDTSAYSSDSGIFLIGIHLNSVIHYKNGQTVINSLLISIESRVLRF